mmetsp:Transcript_33197/g.71566  ORF Transcript_33197/g.71566 Transcript_33197/m.71566 type:complete len:283 (-) Transcript_33197:474-1322(-)
MQSALPDQPRVEHLVHQDVGFPFHIRRRAVRLPDDIHSSRISVQEQNFLGIPIHDDGLLPDVAHVLAHLHGRDLVRSCSGGEHREQARPGPNVQNRNLLLTKGPLRFDAIPNGPLVSIIPLRVEKHVVVPRWDAGMPRLVLETATVEEQLKPVVQNRQVDRLVLCQRQLFQVVHRLLCAAVRGRAPLIPRGATHALPEMDVHPEGDRVHGALLASVHLDRSLILPLWKVLLTHMRSIHKGVAPCLEVNLSSGEGIRQLLVGLGALAQLSAEIHFVVRRMPAI